MTDDAVNDRGLSPNCCSVLESQSLDNSETNKPHLETDSIANRYLNQPYLAPRQPASCDPCAKHANSPS